MIRLKLKASHKIFNIWRFKTDADLSLDEIRKGASFFSFTQTKDEISLVLEKGFSFENALKKQEDFSLIEVLGPLDFSLTGILSSLSTSLSNEGISIFAISTYDTDYLLVRKNQLTEAVLALSEDHDFIS